MRGLIAGGLLLAALPAMADDDSPKPTAQKPAPTVDVSMTPAEASNMISVLDAAIKASGYSPVTVQALQFGEKLERATKAQQGK